MAKHSVLLRPSEVTLCSSLLNIANNTSFQPQYYLLFLSPSYRGLGGNEESPDLYLQVLFTSFWWSRSGIITKIMCVFVVGRGKFQPRSEGCTVENKEIRSLDGEQDHGEQQEEPGVSLSGASTMESSKHLWCVPQRTGQPGS